jgi:hypothetical protein
MLPDIFQKKLSGILWLAYHGQNLFFDLAGVALSLPISIPPRNRPPHQGAMNTTQRIRHPFLHGR